MKLIQKLIKVYEKIDHVEKSGINKNQNYKFVRAADMVRIVRKALLELGVYAEINLINERQYTIAREKAPTAPFTAMDVRCAIIFHDIDSEETISASGLGTGADTADKAAYKAQTGAIKYALRNAFLLPDEADPEADESVDEPTETIPDFQDAARGESKPASNPKGQSTSAASSTQSQASTVTASVAAAPFTTLVAPDAAVDESTPTEDELNIFRAKFKQLGDDLSANGKLSASRALPMGIKLKAFLLAITQAADVKYVTKAQWDDFFQRVEHVKGLPDGLVSLGKLVNKANGIDEKEKSKKK